MNKEFIKSTLSLLEQKLQKLDKEMSEIKAYVVVLKDALEQDEQPTVAAVLSKMQTGGIAIDLPKKVEKKLTPQGEANSRCKCRKRSLKIHPELCRTLVEAYEEYRTDPKGYGKMETLNKLKSDLNLPYSVDTINRAIFHHKYNKGYEDIPTPQELPSHTNYTNEETVRDAKQVKYLLRFNLSNQEISSLTGCDPRKISKIRNETIFGWVNLLPEDEEIYKHRFAEELKQKGITVNV